MLESIRKNLEGKFQYEVIVVDNGSTDRTLDIAHDNGAICLHAPGCSISTLRNMGAQNASADIFIFIDADVYVTREWGEQIGRVPVLLQQRPMLITGSLYGISEENNWIERIWFAPRTTRSEVSYINGGHLILHRQTFLSVEGFAPHLETGEDCEFCERARARGATIENNPALKVVHAGYPRTIKRFFARERWHGRGDFHSVATLIASKPALISLLNLVMLMACLAFLFFSTLPWFLPILFYMAFLMGISLASAFHRQSGAINAELAGAMFLYMIYITARTAALVDVVCRRVIHHRPILPTETIIPHGKGD